MLLTMLFEITKEQYFRLFNAQNNLLILKEGNALFKDSLSTF